MTRLSKVLLFNASTCIGFGWLFFWVPLEITSLLAPKVGLNPWIIQAIGGGLLLQGGLLIGVATSQSIHRLWVIYFSVGDFLWVAGTLLCIFQGQWITTSIGIISALAVAFMVGIIGFLQYRFGVHSQTSTAISAPL